MNVTAKVFATFFATLAMSHVSAAQPKDEILKVKKSTFVNLVDLLVQRGVIDQQEGQGLITAAEQEAMAETASPPPAKPQKGVKHVTYVPEIVKKEIREEVRAELREELLEDVKEHAKTERWGIPDALPEWISAIEPSFDMRIRFNDDFQASGNVNTIGSGPYFDFLAINRNRGFANEAANEGFLLNNQKDRLAFRQRFRLAFDTKIAEGLSTGVRISSTNDFSPVSTQQSLGNTGGAYQLALDRAFIRYDYADDKGNDWLTLLGGRILNPFVSTDVLFDPDLSFEGIAGSFRLPFNRGSSKFSGYKAPTQNPTSRFGLRPGLQHPDSAFVTLGVFPIQDIDFSAQDKWLYAGQVGLDWLFEGQSRLNIAASYYHYQNIHARKNGPGGTGFENDWTAPQFVQKGNSMVAITDFDSGPGFGSVCADPVRGCLFGLASKFQIFNLTAMYDYPLYDDIRLLLTADYAKNLGFNGQRILRQFGETVKERTDAFQVRVDVGTAEILQLHDWNFNLAYRYVQRDAVLDAFTESVFHQGGTNAEGWQVSASYGLARNTWLNFRWLSTQAIDGPQFDVDTLNLDLNVRFF
ncbi:MAG: putative porin [Methylococcales bacterium]|nr:putative porin [Methylococcales bacterium]